MDAEQAWQSALGQLQMEMPKASFDTWVRDTQLVSYDDGLFTIGVRNSYTRDWLDSRLSSTVVRLLMGIMNRSVDVCFVVQESNSSEDDVESDDNPVDHGVEESNIPESLHGSADYLTRYEKTVKPHRVVVVPGYLMRLLPERKGAAIFAYIGFSQVAWMNSRRDNDDAEEVAFDAPIVSIAKFSGSNRTAFYKLMGKTTFWESLSGMVSRTGDGFILHRTLPLTKADAQCVANWLKSQIDAGGSLEDAIRSALRSASWEVGG